MNVNRIEATIQWHHPQCILMVVHLTSPQIIVLPLHLAGGRLSQFLELLVIERSLCIP